MEVLGVKKGYGHKGVFYDTREGAEQALADDRRYESALALAQDASRMSDRPLDTPTIVALLRAHEEVMDQAALDAALRNRDREGRQPELPLGVDRGFDGCPPGCS